MAYELRILGMSKFSLQNTQIKFEWALDDITIENIMSASIWFTIFFSGLSST